MVNYSLDLTAYRCPIPLLATKKATVTLQTGDVLTVLLHKDIALQDFHLLCKEMSCEIKIQRSSDDQITLFIIKK